MATIDEIRKNRIKKLKAIKKAGFNPYPAKTKRTHTINEIISNFSKFQKAKKKLVLAGRIRLIRGHGKSLFLHFEDGSGKIQAYFKQDILGEKRYKFFLNNFDIGDFVEIKGALFKTKTNERTIQASDFTMLAKSLRPLPEKWHGLQDIEQRYRKRYLDLLMNPEVRKRFDTRTKLIKEIRNYLDKLGYLEVETPTLQSLYGGTNARPFITHLNAFNKDFYLRVADELYLKRLVIGGYDKIYEICKDFRNEGIDLMHNPEFTMIEFYEAYVDYNKIMDITEGLFKYLARKIFGKTILQIHDKKINIGQKWPRIELTKAIKKYLKIDVEKMNKQELSQFCKKNNIEVLKGMSKGQLIFEIFERLVSSKLINPVWIIDYPEEVSPLSKKHFKKQGFVERFEGYVGGKEICDGWTEINDPLDQRHRFEQDQAMARKAKDKIEAHPIDQDFLEAMEYGMPPLGGIGIGIDRLTMFFTNTWSIKEVILFPTLRPKTDQKVSTEKKKAGVSQKDNKDIFNIDGGVKKKFPAIKVGVALIEGVEVKKKVKELEEYKKQVFAELKSLKTEEIGKISSIKAYRKLFKAFGIDYHSRRPAPEALLRRIATGQGLYQVNNVVDAYNLAVLQTKISLGAFDLDNLVLPKVLRFAKKGEEIILLGESAPTAINEGELIYTDQKGPVTLDLNYRDCNRTKIIGKTKNIFLIADGCEGISRNEVKKALDLGCELITKFAGGEVIKKFIIT